MGARIEIIPRVNSQRELASVMASADCGLFPSRAEAWGMPCHEMMSIGKAIIATNLCGMSEYVNEDNSYVIHHNDVMEPAIEPPFFNGRGKWAALGSSHIELCIEHMRHIHMLKQSGGLSHNEAGIETAKRFSWRNTAEKLIEGLS
jgi:glycosyltransferase involved in cell wall biosynthesis